MSGLEVGELFASNESLQDAPAVRLFAAKNLAAYVTLMERHLDGSAKITEAELVSRIEQDLNEVGLPDQTGLGLIKGWASSGWLNRLSDGTGQASQNVCSLTEDARSVLAFLRRLRRADNVATGGSMVSIASGLKRIASQLDGDPERIRIDLEEQIEALYRQLEDLAEGRRPEPNLVDLADEGRAIAYQMEQVITDILRYGGMQNEITTALIEGPEDSDTAFRDRSRRLFTDYEALLDSRERASYTAFTRMVQDPDRRARLRSDITTVVESLPDLDAACARSWCSSSHGSPSRSVRYSGSSNAARGGSNGSSRPAPPSRHAAWPARSTTPSVLGMRCCDSRWSTPLRGLSCRLGGRR
ncbi:DUF3375 domain-containing protein [Mycobacterium ahvazicum]|uniref:Alanine and proline rich protein n=2 Tax=Mycobacterium simiae complex TaxID=2249310 RepID=A0A024K6R1_9MYCO|nr:hypothetical protein BN973_06005 [Mycobacterium triplex]SOX51347.1 DUF3375 domain-containing protein [Mycobacterium ahvazicum]